MRGYGLGPEFPLRPHLDGAGRNLPYPEARTRPDRLTRIRSVGDGPLPLGPVSGAAPDTSVGEASGQVHPVRTTGCVGHDLGALLPQPPVGVDRVKGTPVLPRDRSFFGTPPSPRVELQRRKVRTSF